MYAIMCMVFAGFMFGGLLGFAYLTDKAEAREKARLRRLRHTKTVRYYSGIRF